MSPEEAKAAAEAARVPGTENYRALGDGPVGHQAIEANSIIGHDNLEAESEVDKLVREQGESPDGRSTF